MPQSNKSIYSEELRQFAREQENKVKAKAFKSREHKEPDVGRSQNRDEYRRDYARVLYSSSFRRLQGKMQLLGIDPTNFYRNRLTHSLEVAQIARSIAIELELEDPIVAETCSLSHDLGNPPFGHAGEKILNELAKNIGGYEGNAQTFRILRSLEKKLYEPGLNLTLRTLLGITKYFQVKGENPQKPNKFIYNDDYEFLTEKLRINDCEIKKSIDVQIMDLADEIAYAAHDLEDSISFGYITLSEIMYEFDIDDEFKEVRELFKEKIATPVRKIASTAKVKNRLNTSEEYSFILKKELTSHIVHRLITDINIVEKDGQIILGFKELEKVSKGLKTLVFKALLRKKDVQLYEKKGEKVIRGLYEVYRDKNFNKNLMLLPPEYRAISEKSGKSRVIIDYIAGMMDSFAIQEYERYFGASSLSKIYN